jgi:hypothetical protein
MGLQFSAGGSRRDQFPTVDAKNFPTSQPAGTSPEPAIKPMGALHSHRALL